MEELQRESVSARMSTKGYVIVLVSSFGLMILGGIIGRILESSGVVTRETSGAKGMTAIMAGYFVLFCVGSLAFVPVVIRLFTRAQIKIGNADLFLVRWLEEHEQTAVYGTWGLFIAGLCIALPGMIKGGFFK